MTKLKLNAGIETIKPVRVSKRPPGPVNYGTPEQQRDVINLVKRTKATLPNWTERSQKILDEWEKALQQELKDAGKQP